jgi:hypothetical protein
VLGLEGYGLRAGNEATFVALPAPNAAAAVAAALDGPPVPRPRDAPWPDAVPVVRASPGRPDLRLPLVLGAVVLAAVLGAAVLCRPGRHRRPRRAQ